MSQSPATLPPVLLHSEAELARDALATPLLGRAVRLARWAGPDTRVGAGGELVDEQLPAAAAELGLVDGVDGLEAGDAAAYASEAWRVAVDTGLVEVEDADEDDAEGTVATGEELALITSGGPQDVLGIWLGALDTVFADATVPDLENLVDVIQGGGEIDFAELGWDPQAEAEFLEGVLGNLYLLTVSEGAPEDGAVPLPALAASMIVPDDMGEPTDDILEQVSDAMMRLDDQFRMLEPVGLVAYRPVDEALMADVDEAEAAAAAGEPLPDVDDEDVTRYGMVRLTPLGLYGVRARMLDAGVDAPAVGDLADKGADSLLDATAAFPRAAAQAEIEQWLDGREPLAAARDLLAAARGADEGAPLRRLHCQQALSLVGGAAEPALREVLDDAELGGLARVWLAEHGAADVPAPSEGLVFWLTIDTVAAQLAAEGNSDELRDLVEGLAAQHSGFFAAAWRVDHPATAEVLEAMGRLHSDKKVAKEARKAAFKARSQQP
ncbi:hypothetical protein [Streptomyces spectabilis]|uniref:Uncharacterized protein n=1 Tax=Streptomyces spectabilis TaxID=68270 RepID=A0A5P2X2H8_STRST|nr:hypothetical protein [Streptomyces spectabilis]MBB5108582.1 hypothetical protein [Streptomyces spectabilis]MCI3901797.1 hypothetical protein [Streptomyces spectabilis]QEV59227.1 hypothetical protein CP982_11185 [Streptomyces spectabilis]GGV47069.1 hypothetical protein GCM10010245_73850 [Streptomyces spectabilis]